MTKETNDKLIYYLKAFLKMAGLILAKMVMAFGIFVQIFLVLMWKVVVFIFKLFLLLGATYILLLLCALSPKSAKNFMLGVIVLIFGVKGGRRKAVN